MSGGGDLLSSGAGSLALAALILAIAACAAAVVLLVRQQRLIGQYRHLMAGTSGGNLEAMLNDHVAHVRETLTEVQDVRRLAERLERGSHLSLQHLGLVRFNPFHDTGGDQSVAIAVADDYGNGLVLSSLHSRDATRVYAKPLMVWQSTYSLTEEEKQAIAMAQKAS
jgi:hypothetical protein